VSNEVQGPVIVWSVDLNDATKSVANFDKSVQANLAGMKTASEKAFDSFTARANKLSAELSGGKANEKLRDIATAAKILEQQGKLTDQVVLRIGADIQRLAGQAGQVPKELNSIVAAAERIKGKVNLGAIVSDEALSKVKGMTSQFGSLGTALAAAGPAGLAVGAGIAGIVGYLGALGEGAKFLYGTAEAAVKFAGHLTDLSAKTDLSVEALQRLGAGGLEVGVTMEDVSSTVFKMQKNLEKAPEAFERIGLSVEHLKTLGPEQQLQEVAKAISGIEDPAKRNAMAMDLLGKSAAEVMPFLRSGFIQAGIEAEKSGRVMSASVVERLDNLGDKAAALGSTWEHLWLNVGAALADNKDIIEGIDGITAALGRLSKFSQDHRELVVNAVRAAAYVATGGVSEDVIAIARAVNAATPKPEVHSGKTLPLPAQLLAGTGIAPQMFSGVGPLLPGPLLSGSTPTQVRASPEDLKALAVAEKDLTEARAKGLPTIDREIIGIRATEAAKVAEAAVSIKDAGVRAQVIADYHATADAAVKAATAEHNLAVAKQLLAGENAVATAKEKLTLDSFEQQVKGIERTRDARIQDIQSSHEQEGVKAKLIQLTKDEAAANIAAAKAADMISFGADNAENQRNLDNLVKQFERVNKELDAAGRKMSAGGIADFRKRLSDLAENTPAAGKLGSISDKEFGELGASGGQRKAALEAENDVVEKGKGLWERKRVAADEANQAEIDGAKKVRDGLEDEIRLIVLAAQKSQQLGGIFSQLGSIAGTLGSGFGSNALGGVGGIFGAVSGLQSLKAKSLTEHVSGLEMFSSKLGVVGAGINLGMTLVNGIKSAFVKSESEKVAGDLGKKFGVKFTDGLGKAIEETEKSKGLGRDMAELLNLDKIMGESGLDPSKFKKQIGDLLNATALGTVKSTDGIDQLGKAFDNLKTAAEGGSVASETAMTAMIHRAKELGLAIPEIDTFVRDTLKDAASHLEEFFKGQGSEILTKMRNGSGPDGADTVTGAVSAKQAEANQAIFGAVFEAEAALNGLVATAEDTQKAFEEMVRSLPSGTVLTGQAAEVAQILEALKNPLYKGAADTASSGAKIFADLRKTDNLSPEVVGAFETTLQTGMDEARKGLEGIPNLTEDQQRRLTEQANLPMLVEMQHARAAGMHLDAATEKALAQADADHLLPALSIAEQQLAVQKQIRDGQKGDNTNTTDGGDGSGDGGGGNNTTTNTGGGPPPNDFGGHGTDAGNHQWIPHYAEGGMSTTQQLAVVDPNEFHVPFDKVGDFVRQAMSGQYEFHSPKGSGTTTAEMAAVAAAAGAGRHNSGPSNADVVAGIAALNQRLDQHFSDLPWRMRKAMKS
jgi:hypothetical protein